MQATLFFFVVVAVVSTMAVPQKLDHILLARSDLISADPTHPYLSSFKTGGASDIIVEESGSYIPSDDNKDVTFVKKGRYAYVEPKSGETIEVLWTAGKEGFKAEGRHLPRV